jgi:putative ABC transport system ATP-binding protein
MPLIDAHGLTKTFEHGDGATQALRGVDIVIDRGEFVAIVGPSGSGKSTLLQILGLLDGASGGTYIFDGKDTAAFSDDDLAQLRNERLGFIFQSFNLLARTDVRENVMLPLGYSNIPRRQWAARATEVVEAVGLGHRADHAPNELSGGERQRVAIARALITEPDVIFADEPTGNLDSASGKAVLELLEKLHREGKTVVLITHDLTLAARAKRVIRIKDGLVEYDGVAEK